MFKKLATTLALAGSMMFGAGVLAQDTVPAEGLIGIGDITADSAAYYGQTLTVQGNVDELVNIRSFVIGDGGLGNPQLLVLNNSGEEFNIGLTGGAVVQVTGTIYPSYNGGGWDLLLGEMGTMTTGMDTVEGADTAGMDTTMVTPEGADTAGMDTAMVTEEGMDTTGMDTTMVTPEGADTTGMDTTGMDTTMTEGSHWVGLSEYPVVIFTDRFPDHTLLVVNSIDDIVFVETE